MVHKGETYFCEYNENRVDFLFVVMEIEFECKKWKIFLKHWF